MSRWTALPVALIAGLLIVVGGSGPAADAATGGWHFAVHVAAATPDGSSEFVDVSAPTDRDIWAVGDHDVASADGLSARPLLEHWNGRSWKRLAGPTLPTTFREPALTGVTARSAKDVWITGFAGYGPQLEQDAFVSHSNGVRWGTHNLGVGWSVGHIAVFGPANAWILGAIESNGVSHARYAHWDGKRWTTGALPAVPISGNSESSSPDWASAEDSTTFAPRLLHWTGHQWVVAPAPHVTLPKGARSARFADIVEVSAHSIWLTVGYGGNESLAAGLGLWHWNGHTWRRVLQLAKDAPSGMTTDGAGGLWLLSTGLHPRGSLLHYINGKIAKRVAAPTYARGTMQIEALSRVPSHRAITTVGEVITSGDAAAVIARYTP
jgi:hypothetical protein